MPEDGAGPEGREGRGRGRAGVVSERVCYYVQTHRAPEQILRLVRALRHGSPGSCIVVLHDFAAGELDPAPLAALPGVHLLRSSYAHVRGRFSGQAQPLLDAIAWLAREGVAYDWLVTLTGQDYPVAPPGELERRLAAGGCDGFLRFWDVESAASPWPRRKARRRYWYRYRRLPDALGPALPLLRAVTRMVPGLHLSLDYGPWLGVRCRRTPWRGGYRCYGGWTWFALRRPAVDLVARELAAGSPLGEHYRGTMSPEESMVQTVLLNDGRFRLVDDDLRYVDYAGAVRGSPRTLTAADWPALASGRYCFARKFDLATDATVLDRIDRELLGGSPGSGLARADSPRRSPE